MHKLELKFKGHLSLIKINIRGNSHADILLEY